MEIGYHTCFLNLSLSVIFVVFLSIGVSEALQPILNVKIIKETEPFTITCDANRVQIPVQDSNVRDLYGLVIGIKSLEYPSLQFFAAYHPTLDAHDREEKEIPAGRDWIVKFSNISESSKNDTGNFNWTKIETVVRDSNCTDAGLYICKLQYTDDTGSLNEVMTSQNISAQAATTYPDITLEPFNGYVHGPKNYSYYYLDTVVMIVCRVYGPPNLVIIWRRKRKLAFGFDVSYQDYPYDNKFSSAPVQQNYSSTCKKWKYISQLRITVSPDDKNRTYQCVVQDGGVDVVISGAIINAITDFTTIKPKEQVSTGIAETSFFFGVTLGCLLSIVIAVTTIFIVYDNPKTEKKALLKEAQNNIPTQDKTQKVDIDQSTFSDFSDISQQGATSIFGSDIDSEDI